MWCAVVAAAAGRVGRSDSRARHAARTGEDDDVDTDQTTQARVSSGDVNLSCTPLPSSSPHARSLGYLGLTVGLGPIRIRRSAARRERPATSHAAGLTVRRAALHVMCDALRMQLYQPDGGRGTLCRPRRFVRVRASASIRGLSAATATSTSRQMWMGCATLGTAMRVPAAARARNWSACDCAAPPCVRVPL
jgi:hypothetical protein